LLLISLAILAVFLNYRRLIVIEVESGDKKSLGKARTKEGSMGGCDTPIFRKSRIEID
jgi:hypothetical protein